MTRRNSLIGPILGGAAILVALYTILFGGISSFSSQDAERILSELSSHLAEESAHRGKEAKLQYSNVEIQGLAYEKWAHISKLSLDFIYQQWQGGTRFSISTEGADLIPDPTNADRLVLRLRERLNLISSSELLAMIQPAKPILYTINRKPADLPDAIRHKLIIPGNLGVTMLDPKREIAVQLATPLQAEATFFKTQHHLRAQATSGAVQALTDRGIWRLSNADLRYDSVQKSEGTMEIKGTLALDNLGFTHGNIAPLPMTVTAAWTMKQQRNISGATDSSQLTIEHGLLTDGEVKIATNGVMNFDIDDSPYGEITIEINHPAQLIAGGWIASNKRDLALSLLNQIMGDNVEENTQVIIPVTRDKNGVWKVGKITLDDLLAKGFLSLFTFLETQENEENDPA